MAAIERPLPDRISFTKAYTARPPWDIDGPQPDLVSVADRISPSFSRRGSGGGGSLLDAGCGTGENALFFAERGCDVTGIDFLEAPIQRAREKAAIRNLNVNFLVKDALTLKDWDSQFDNAIDSGLFHVFSDEDAATYVAGLHHVLKPGGHLYLLCFSDSEPGVQGPRRIPKQMLYYQFRIGWEVESITPTHYEVRPEFKGTMFSAEGPNAWFAIVKRV